MRLKGGFHTDDPRLDRVPSFDERSRRFPVSVAVPADVKGRSWPCRARLDQGSEGACVGFAWAHELAAVPLKRPADGPLARDIYRHAQTIDEWPGENYSGTSVLAGAKTVQTMGFITEYRWAFSIDDALRALSHVGPVVFGLPWLDSMFEPKPNGVLDCSGVTVGGHAILGRGLRVKTRMEGRDGPWVRLLNSWGESWGPCSGDCFIHAEDLERLLGQGGECCVPMGRK